MENKIRKEKEDVERIEKERLIKEQEKKEELERQEKYQNFLKKNNYTENNKNDFIIQRKDNKITIFKKVDEIIIK